MRRLAVCGLFGCLAAAGCASCPAPRTQAGIKPDAFPGWTAEDAQYRLFPGDRFRVDVRTAPELDGEVVIAPDGRATLPLIGPVMVANRTATDIQAILEHAYASELIDPSLTVSPTGFGSQKIFVGGDVKTPGVFDLPGEIDALQAVLLAGGWTDRGKPTHVIVLRRAPDGKLLTRVLNLRAGGALSGQEIGPLHRFDVVYVSRKVISNENVFMKQFIRDALPIDFSIVYGVIHF
ncbi:MAG: polysaccharide export protein [Alphaproteobacteria bacterium]|nr:polysaccharide export protein [Alphaproteobacteria bacterium]